MVERIRRIDEDKTLLEARKLVPLRLRHLQMTRLFLRYSFIYVKSWNHRGFEKRLKFWTRECAAVINVRLLTSACKLCGELRLLDYTSRYSNRAESAAFAKYAPHSYISMLVAASSVSIWKLQRIKVFAAPANKIGNIARYCKPRRKCNCWEEFENQTRRHETLDGFLRSNARWRLRLSMHVQVYLCHLFTLHILSKYS